MSRITFIGDVMLGRMVGAKYKREPYRIVSEGLEKEARDAIKPDSLARQFYLGWLEDLNAEDHLHQE